MYLTQMKLNPSRQGTRRAMGSDQVMHAMVLSSFPHLGESDRVLWRTDVGSRSDIALYVVSSQRPDMTGLVEQAGWPLQQTWKTAGYDHLLNRLEVGQRWRFRLTANPTNAVSQGAGQRGKVRPCRTVAQQQEWLVRKSKQIGATFGEVETPSFVVVKRELSAFPRHDPALGQRGRVELTKATYEGVLEVKDVDLLRNALTLGIGRGKAYGCGLLTLAAG